MSLRLLFILYQLLFVAGMKGDHCDIHRDHIFCRDRGFHPRCGNVTAIVGTKVTRLEIDVILKAHNNYRNRVASGLVRVPGGILPVASNMEQLVWDEEMAAMSEKYVKRCLFEHSCDVCTNVDRFRVGENLHWRGTNYWSPNLYKYSWDSVVQAWTAEEEKFFHINQVRKLTLQNLLGYKVAKYGHLSQALWGHTRYVGCGRIVFRGPQNWETISSCHYGPTGNILHFKIYKEGRSPCSQCPDGRKCSNQYSALCSPKPPKKSNPSPPIQPEYHFPEFAQVDAETEVETIELDFSSSRKAEPRTMTIVFVVLISFFV